MIRARHFLPALVIALTQLFIGQEQPTAKPQLAARPSRTTDFRAALNGGWHFWTWDRNQLLTYRLHVQNGGVAAALTDQTGQTRRVFRISVAGAEYSSLTAATVTPNETVVVGGGSVDEEGRVSSFIGIADSSDVIHPIFRTHPFVPLRMCSTDDKTVWAYGWERSAQDWRIPATTYPVLRGFDLQQGQIKAVIDRTSIKAVFNDGRRPEEVVLACGGSNVALFFAESGQLFVLNTVTNELSSASGAALAVGEFHGLIVQPSGEILELIMRNGAAGVFQWKQAGAFGEWAPVLAEPIFDKAIGTLTGASGNHLLFMRRDRSEVERRALTPTTGATQ